MVGAGIGVTLIPDMAVVIEANSAPVSVARFARPGPSRTIGMIWRRSTPMAAQLLQISDQVRTTALTLHGAMPVDAA
jgi:LysR family hydrogen peroxide-inducible transcriptional activator